MNALEQIAAQATRLTKKIVLPEGGDERVVRAAEQVVAQGLAEIILLGNTEEVAALAKTQQPQRTQRTQENFQVMDTQRNANSEKYAEVLRRAQTRRGKRMTRAQARQQIQHPLHWAMCMVACGDADGCVAGTRHSTADVVRAALQIVGMQAGCNLASSFFIMQPEPSHQALRGAVIFADCALVIDPDAAQLARIAMDSTDSAVALLGLQPRLALLSFSTAGSAEHPQVSKVREAGNIIAQQRPELALIPEVQFDAAVIPEILRRKAPAIQTEAPANIFIFPDLQSANIGYKIAERLGAVRAVGPILQGLRRPVNDLSRGCCVADIVQLVAVTAVQAQVQAQAAQSFGSPAPGGTA